MPNTPHSSCRRSSSRSTLSVRFRRPFGLIHHLAFRAPAGVSVSARPQQGGRRRSKAGTAAGRGFRLLLVFRLVALQPFQNGAFGVFRQHRHQPLPGSLQDHARLRVLDPFGLAAVRHQPGEEQEGHHHDHQPAPEAEQEAERAVERADPAVQDHVGDLDGDDRDDEQRAEEHAADGDRRGHDVVGKVLQNNGLEPWGKSKA